jgi:hypothetical protein
MIINEFLRNIHTKEEWKGFCLSILPTWSHDFFELCEDNGMLEDPASTKYHGASMGGLIKHSLLVVHELRTLIDAWELQVQDNPAKHPWIEEAIVAAFFHDVCKIGLYTPIQKWRKDEYGKWEGYMGYDIDPHVVQIGHGCESLRLLEKYIHFDYEGWAQAINWHMGMPSEWLERQQYMKACETYPEVLALHTADMRAVISGKY